MKQQINLFQNVLRPRHVTWSAKHLSVAMMITFSSLFALELFGFWQSWMLKQDLVTAETLLEERQIELKTVEAKYPRPQEDQRLVQRVIQLEEEVRNKQQILGLLTEDEHGNTRGFAEHLTGLSKQHVNGIWLTRLTIDKGGKQLDISGGSLKPELVPEFLQRLGSEASFAGKEFKTFVMSRAESKDNWINFDLSTESNSESKP